MQYLYHWLHIVIIAYVMSLIHVTAVIMYCDHFTAKPEEVYNDIQQLMHW